MDSFRRNDLVKEVQDKKRWYYINLGFCIAFFICIFLLLLFQSSWIENFSFITKDFFSKFSTTIAMIAVLLAFRDFRTVVAVREDYPFKLSFLVRLLKKESGDMFFPISIVLTIVLDYAIKFNITVDTILALVSLVTVFLGFALSNWSKSKDLEETIPK